MIRVPRDLKESEQNLYIAAYNKCKELRDREEMEIKDIIREVCSFFCVVIEDVKRLEDFLLSEVSVETEPIITFISEEKEKSDWWTKLNDDSSFSPQYWTRYKNYLMGKDNWSLKAISDIDEATNDAMNVLSNPLITIEQETIGLEFGYVQSGKTAHYIGLINKAIDAGYRIIIILSGIHNNLRSQTQSRIDEEVLGYETSLDALIDFQYRKNAIGVGIGKNNQILDIKQMQSLTTRDEKGDFNKKVAGTSMHPPFMIITKKNATVLKKIISYLQKCPFSETTSERKKYIPANIPALIIDDEADQASVNTKDCYDEHGNLLDDFNPTTINGLIRKLLMLFENRSYVGYTATPYANIFIPPEAAFKEYGNDLYPKDFILRIPRADMYVGAKEFFGLKGNDESPAMPLCRDITKGKDYLSKGTKASDFVSDIPDELKMAIKCFLVSTAVRNCRGQKNKPNTMLIHIVRFIEQQNAIKKRVQTYKEYLFSQIQYGDEDLKEELEEIWVTDYCETTQKMHNEFPKYMKGTIVCSWNDIFSEIKRIVLDKEMIVYSINGKSTDSLMYKNHKDKPFNVIVIGGDKLSRGLTLEGLTISYFTRSSSTYDTLMQMGRWFGYRPGYLDLCRLFTTKVLKGYFYHISMATEDLVSQFDFMKDTKQTPKTFGLRVATHPDLLISSKNKVRTGIEMKRDFSNNLNQTRSFDIDVSQFENNFFAVESLIKTIGKHRKKEEYWAEKKRQPIGEHFFWTNVSGYAVATFLEAYETSKKATRANSKYMADYIRNQISVGGLVDWTVCLINVGHNLNRPFDIAGLSSVGAGIERKNGCEVFDDYCSIKTMTSEGHEYLDYSKSQIDKLDILKKEYKKENDETTAEYIRRKTRDRTSGLLILYPIGQVIGFTDVFESQKTPFGFAIVFPDREGEGDLKSYRYNDIATERDSYEYND